MQNLTQLNTPNALNAMLANQSKKNTQTSENTTETNAFQQTLTQQMNKESSNQAPQSTSAEQASPTQPVAIQKQNVAVKSAKTQSGNPKTQNEKAEEIPEKNNTKLNIVENITLSSDVKDAKITISAMTDADQLIKTSESLLEKAGDKNTEKTTEDAPTIIAHSSNGAISPEALLASLQNLNPRLNTQPELKPASTAESSPESLLSGSKSDNTQAEMNNFSAEKPVLARTGDENSNPSGLNITEKSLLDTMPSKTDFNAMLLAQTAKPNETTQSIANTNAEAVAQAAVTAQNSQTQTLNSIKNTEVINLPLQHEGWNQAVSQKVVWMANNSQQTATLTLNPPDLGPLQVVINVHHDQTDTTFLSDNKEVRQALQDGMDNLRNAMKEAGISLGQTNIHERQQSQNFNQSNQRNNASAKQVESQKNQVTETTSAIKVKTTSGVGLVDTFA